MINIDQLFLNISKREESQGWNDLSVAERTIATVMLLWYEVGNGGFDQYFYNSTGDLALDAPEAFRAIGANQTANIVEQANALFGTNGPDKNRRKRQKKLKKITKSHANKLNELDNYIFDDPEDIEVLLSEYAEKHSLRE